jgi:ribosomal protein S18 acetylase RimI-like enzyme
VGILKVDRSGPEWKIIQIQIEPELQGHGVGSMVLRQVITEAEAKEVSLALSVLKLNPAMALYERLGFSVVGEGVHEYEMRRSSGHPRS